MLRIFSIIVAAFFCLPQLALAEPSIANYERLKFRKLVALNPPEQIWAPVYRTKGVATAYCKPVRRNYRSDASFRAAQKLNGKGEETRTGMKPRYGMISANMRKFPAGTNLRITDERTRLSFISEVQDTGDAMRKDEKHVDIFLGENKDECMYWGKRKVIIEVVKLDIRKMFEKAVLAI